MDEENMYDEFGNYIGPEIDENVINAIYSKDNLNLNYIFHKKVRRRRGQILWTK